MHGPIRYTFYQRAIREQEGPTRLRPALLLAGERGHVSLVPESGLSFRPTAGRRRAGRKVRRRSPVRAQNHEPVLALPQDLWLGRRRTEFIPILPADQCARSSGTNRTEKRRLLAELHHSRAARIPVAGGGAGGDAPDAQASALGLLYGQPQPPKRLSPSWDTTNQGGAQRELSKNGMNSVLPRSHLGGAVVSWCATMSKLGWFAPSENGRLPHDLAHQLASTQENLICPNGSPDSVTY